jgi:hypothetical protein
MNLNAILNLRLRPWAPVVFGMLALGLVNVVFQTCALAETVVADSTQASIVYDGPHADPTRQMACETQLPCLLCAAHEGASCDSPPDEDCVVADGPIANSSLKPKERSFDLTIATPPAKTTTASFPRVPAVHTPVPVPPPTGPRLHIRYCVYLK